MNDTDEEALSWAGDADRAQMPLPKRSGRRGASPSPGNAAQPKVASNANGASKAKSASKAKTVAEPAAGDAGLSSPALIGLGALGGAMLLETIAWLITALRNPITIADALGQTMFSLGLWFAIAAPVLWFAVSWLQLRKKSLRWLMLSLALGVLILLPWPYFGWVG